MEVKKCETILIGKEAYFYLRGIMNVQRGGKPFDEATRERVWSRMTKVDGVYYRANDHSLGGGDGTYYGRWWSWSVEELKEMLTAAGYEYKDGGEMEYISVTLW